MSNFTKTTSEPAILSLLKELDSLSRQIQTLKEKVLKMMPAKYGSDLWWEKSDQEAIESIKAGRSARFNTYEEAIKYLQS